MHIGWHDNRMHQHQNLTPAMTQHAARSVFSPPCEAARLEEELSKRKKGLDTAIFLDVTTSKAPVTTSVALVSNRQ